MEEVVIDTYALMAIVYDEVGEDAREVFMRVKSGEVKGLIPATVAYEYVVHWLRGRIPGLQSLDEVMTYLRSYFKLVSLTTSDFIEAAKIKVEGDNILRNAEDEELRSRRLSIVDSTVIALALKRKAPLITGDKDLAYVARAKGVKVVW